MILNTFRVKNYDIVVHRFKDGVGIEFKSYSSRAKVKYAYIPPLFHYAKKLHLDKLPKYVKRFYNKKVAPIYNTPLIP